MEVANLLASILGTVLVVVPLSLLINPAKIKKLISAMDNEIAVYLMGVVSLVLGTIIILLNNVWAKDWKTIITVIGWLMIIRGIISIFWQEICIEMMRKVKDAEWISYVALGAFFVGLVCLYFGLVG